MDVLLLHPTPCQRSSLAIAEDMLDSANRVAALRGEPAPFRWRTLRPEAVSPETPKPELVLLPGMGLASAQELRTAMNGSGFATLTDALRQLARPGTRIASACSGVFALAAAGLLDGRRVTTTWWLAPLLRSWFPKVRVEMGEVLCSDGALVTAGASFAQIDLMLHLIETQAGYALAEDCRRFLLADSRPSQLPYLSVATLVAGDPALQRVELYLRRHIARQVPLAELAEAAGLGARTFARRLSRVAGMTPSEFAQTLRVTEAIRLYRAGGLSLEQVAHRVGYGDATALRRVMTRRTGRRLESFRT
ncbi:helix-turn-helix domain-containing protein [Ruegeria pomeroyi]|uniref:Helix-turn-helix domain-containing protein n=1 Tax=Ruegeria pomeroyi TaxID=89184 RepID=A0A9Q3WM83_9RHOB|nr:helix-turn-helix domain-containing protein [Ruegeria pomeroyi]MCE8515821.1 helix-turn-helix domain-containing protein [Ruegeria pomeroyi]MCE8538671.1 helix-turn-helix domain-containing protein [Ruegeria pomeroyi]